MKEIWLISGIPASGKTTTSKKLAERLNKTVYISADDFRSQITTQVFPYSNTQEEVKEQSEMIIIKQCNLAKSSLEKGITPICDEVVGKEELSLYKNCLEGCDLLLVTLNPPFHVVVERDNGRSDEQKFDTESNPLPNPKKWWEHLKQLILTVSDNGLWVDNSKMTIEETVTYILHNKEKCIVK
jgi:predicted kinase